MIERSAEITFYFDGKQYSGYEGESISAALLRAGVTNIRTPAFGGSRGIFCGMGVCQECVVEVDGKKQESCRTGITQGLKVTRANYV
ncbi:MAG: (2Fe-2S)-binding protein [Emcibacteraceae bacterium]|nr:(2Fe-2S)-binding protein [Emcibacteraceae bacterium]